MDKQRNDVFFDLLRSGLWEQGVSLASFGEPDYKALFERAWEQSVTGLVAAGLEQVMDGKPTPEQTRHFRKEVLALETDNAEMNETLCWLMERLAEEQVQVVLVKGQGVAQCYARPLLRPVGDIDLLLDEENYGKARTLLLPLAQSVGREGVYALHQGMTLASWELELHGTLRTGLSPRIDQALDALRFEILGRGCVRVWHCDGVDISLPDADCDSIVIFTHFLKHFYRGGIRLRQICDWCRLLWSYRDTIDRTVLGQRLDSMGLMEAWKAFGALAVELLGLPGEAMPFYEASRSRTRKADRIMAFILKSNSGRKRKVSYYKKYPYLVRKAVSLGRRAGALCHHARIFPRDVFRFFPHILFNGFRSALHGE